MNKFLKWLASGFVAVAFGGTLAACGGGSTDSGDQTPDEPQYALTIETVYAMAENAGFTGSLDELIEMFKGDSVTTAKLENGNLIVTLSNGAEINCGRVVGEKGEDGVAPEITVGKDGHWYINGQNTGVKAKGEDGKEPQIDIDANGHWTINGKNTGVLAKGQDGKDGSVVSIQNGHWYIDGKDTGVSAIASKGQDGQDGQDGKDGNGIASVERIKTEGLVDTYQITYTDKDKEPSYFTVTNARSISRMEIKDGVLWAYYSDGTSAELGKVVGEDGENGATPSVDIIDGFWYVNGENTGYRAECDCESGGNTVVEEETVTVTFETGFNLAIPQMIVHKGDSIEDLPVPEFTGYEFEGWFVGEGPNAGQVTVVTPISRDMTLVAKWATETTVEFVSHVNHVELGERASFRLEYTGELEILDLAICDEDGYDVTVWQTELGRYPIGKKFIQFEIEPEKIGIQTFTVRWKAAHLSETRFTDFLVTVEEKTEPDEPIKETFAVTFERFSGETVVETVEKGSEIVIPESEALDGFVFVGWYEQNTGKTYQCGETVVVNSDLYLLEVYQPEEYAKYSLTVGQDAQQLPVGNTCAVRVDWEGYTMDEITGEIFKDGVEFDMSPIEMNNGENWLWGSFEFIEKGIYEFRFTAESGDRVEVLSAYITVYEEVVEPTEYNVTFTVYFTHTGDSKTFKTVVGEMTVGDFFNEKVGEESEYIIEKIDMVVDGESYPATFDYLIESDCEISFYVKPVDAESLTITVDENVAVGKAGGFRVDWVGFDSVTYDIYKEGVRQELELVESEGGDGWDRYAFNFLEVGTYEIHVTATRADGSQYFDRVYLDVTEAPVEPTEYNVTFTLMNANTFEEIGTFEEKISEEMTVRDFFDKYVGDEYILWEIFMFVGEEQSPAGQLNSVITQDCALQIYVEYVGLDEFLRISVDEDIPVGETAGFRVDWRGFESVEHGIYQNDVQLTVEPINGVEERLWFWFEYVIPVSGTFEIRVTATRADGTQRVESGYITAYKNEPAEYAVAFKVWYTDLNEEANVTFEPTLTGESTVRTYYEILCQSGQVIGGASVLDGVVVMVGEEQLSVGLDYVLTEACTVYFLVNYSGEVVEPTGFEVTFAVYYVGTEDAKSLTVTQYGEVTLREFYDVRVGYGDEYIVEEIVLIIGDKATSVDFGYVLTEACTVHFHVKAADVEEVYLTITQDADRLPLGKSCGFKVEWDSAIYGSASYQLFKDGVQVNPYWTDYQNGDGWFSVVLEFSEVGSYEFRVTAIRSSNSAKDFYSAYIEIYEESAVEEEIEISFESQKLLKGENAHFTVTVPEGQSMGQVRVWTSAGFPNDNFWMEGEEEIWNDNGQRIKVIYHYAFTPEYSDSYRVEVMPESGEGRTAEAYIDVQETSEPETEYSISTNLDMATVNYGEKFEFTLYLTGFKAEDVLRTVYKDGMEYYVEWYSYWVDENNNPIYETTFNESGYYEIHLTATDPNGNYHQVVMKLDVLGKEVEEQFEFALMDGYTSLYEGEEAWMRATLPYPFDYEYEVFLGRPTAEGEIEILDCRVEWNGDYERTYYFNPAQSGTYALVMVWADSEGMQHQKSLEFEVTVWEKEPEKISHTVLTKEIMLGDAAQIELSVYEGYILQTVTVRSGLGDEYEVSTEQLDTVDGYAKYLVSFYPDSTGEYYIEITCLDGEAMKPIKISGGGNFYLSVVDENGNEVVKTFLSWGYVEEEIYVGKSVSFWVKTNVSDPYGIVYTIATPDQIYTLSAAQASAGIISYYNKYDNGFETQFAKAGEYTISAEYDGMSVTTTVFVQEYVFDGEVETRGWSDFGGVAFLEEGGLPIELTGEFYAPENAEVSLLINGKTVEELTAEKTLVEYQPTVIGWSFGELRVQSYLNILVAGSYEFVLTVDGGEFGSASLDWTLQVLETVDYAEPTLVAFSHDEYAFSGEHYSAMMLVYLPDEYRIMVEGAVSVNGGEYASIGYEEGEMTVSCYDIGNGYYRVDLRWYTYGMGAYTFRLAVICDGQVCVESEEWSVSVVHQPSMDGMSWRGDQVVGGTAEMYMHITEFSGDIKAAYMNGVEIPLSGYVETEMGSFEISVVKDVTSNSVALHFVNFTFAKAGWCEVVVVIEFMGKDMQLENSFEVETFEGWVWLDNEFVIGEEMSGMVEFAPVGAVENAYLALGGEVKYETSGTFTYVDERYGKVVGTGTYEYVYNKETGILEFTLFVEKGQEVGTVYVSYVAVVDGEEYHEYENGGWSTSDLVYFDVDSYFEVGASDNESYLYISTSVENVSFSINGAQAADGVCTGEDWGMVTYQITKLESGATLISFPSVNTIDGADLTILITATVDGVERTQEHNDWVDSEGSMGMQKAMIKAQIGAYAYALEHYYPTEVYEEYKDFAATCKEISENGDEMMLHELMVVMNDPEMSKAGEELSAFAISFEDAAAAKADMVSKVSAVGLGEGAVRWYVAVHVGTQSYCGLGELTEKEYVSFGSFSYLYYALGVITFEGRNAIDIAEEIYAGSPIVGASLSELLQMMEMTETLTLLEEARNAYFGLSESATAEEVAEAEERYLAELDKACAAIYQMMVGGGDDGSSDMESSGDSVTDEKMEVPPEGVETV